MRKRFTSLYCSPEQSIRKFPMLCRQHFGLLTKDSEDLWATLPQTEATTPCTPYYTCRCTDNDCWAQSSSVIQDFLEIVCQWHGIVASTKSYFSTSIWLLKFCMYTNFRITVCFTVLGNSVFYFLLLMYSWWLVVAQIVGFMWAKIVSFY